MKVYTNSANLRTGGWKTKKGGEPEVKCSLTETPTVFIEPIPRKKIELLMDRYPGKEWIGYLIGRTEGEHFFVEDIRIPPHKEATATSAEAEPFHIPDTCIGIIHSHNSMGAFHSGTDQAYIDKNFPISITVSKRTQALEFDIVSYQTTLCDKKVTVKGVVKFVQPEPLFDNEVFLKGAMVNIDKGVVIYKAPSVPQFQLNKPYNPYPLIPTGGGTVIIGGNGEVYSQKEMDIVLERLYKDNEEV